MRTNSRICLDTSHFAMLWWVAVHTFWINSGAFCRLVVSVPPPCSLHQRLRNWHLKGKLVQGNRLMQSAKFWKCESNVWNISKNNVNISGRFWRNTKGGLPHKHPQTVYIYVSRYILQISCDWHLTAHASWILSQAHHIMFLLRF